METPNKGVLQALATSIERLEKRQQKLKNTILTFKKTGCTSDPWAALLWLQSNSEILALEDPVINEMKDQVRLLCDELILKFEADLREAISLRGLSLSGQWPRYYVEYILPIVVDEKKTCIFLGGETVHTFLTEKLIPIIEGQIKLLKPDSSKLEGFLLELYKTYLKLVSLQNRSVAIWDLYKNLVINKQAGKFWRNASSENFRPFRNLEFQSHLTELLKANLTFIDKYQMKLHPPIEKGESMYIYQPAEHRFCHVGRIEFIPMGEEGRD